MTPERLQSADAIRELSAHVDTLTADAPEVPRAD